MTGPIALIAAAGAIAVAELWLTAIAVRRRSTLAGLAGTLGFALIVFAAAQGLNDSPAHNAVAISLAFLTIRAALLALGETLERLLADSPDDDLS